MSKHFLPKKRLLAALLASLLSVSAFVPVVQAVPLFTYPDGMDHAVVSGHSSTFNVESVKANGSLYAGTDMRFYGQQIMDVSGTVGAKGNITGNIYADGTQEVARTVPALQDAIAQNAVYATKFSGDGLIEGKSMSLYTDSTYAAGRLHLDEVSLSGSGYVTAAQDLVCDLIQGNIDTNGCVLYSETGDVIINGSDLTLNGIIYAPEGRIILNVKHLTVNGGLYAQDIIVNGTDCQINQTQQYDSLVTARLTVEAGPDREIYIGETLTLAGECSYDNAVLTWSCDNSAVTFDDPHAANAAVFFSKSGYYTLTLSAAAGSLKASDTLEIHVNDSPSKKYTINEDFSEGIYQGTAADDDRLILGQQEFETQPLEKEYLPNGVSGIKVKSTVSKDRIIGSSDELSIQYDFTGIGTPVSAEEQGVDFIFAIDNSGSMYGTYLENVQIAAKTILDYMHEGDRYAITDLGRQHISFTTDREVLEDEIDRIKSGSGSSEMDDGMEIAIDMFDTDSSENRLKYILLLTDGEDWYNYSLERMHEVANKAAEKGIRVFSIAMHDEMEAMQDIASITKGIYKHCPDADTIGNVMEQCANEIFNTAARNVVFKTTVNDFSKVDAEKISPAPTSVTNNTDGSAELVWALDTFDIDTLRTITIPIASEEFAAEGVEQLTRNTALYYNDKEGTGQKIYTDNITLPCNTYVEEGSWTAVYDSNRPACPWTGISWNAYFPSDSYGEVYVSVSDDNITYSEETLTENYTDLTGLKGRYIRIRTVLHRSSDGITPAIMDLSVISGTMTLSEPAKPIFASSFITDGPPLHANKPFTLYAGFNSSETDEKQWSWSVEGTDAYTIDETLPMQPTISFAEPGNYTIKLQVTNGTDTVESSAKVYILEEENVEDVVYDTPSQSVSYTVERDKDISYFSYNERYETHSLKLVTEHPEAIAWASVRYIPKEGTVSRVTSWNAMWIYSIDEELYSEFQFPTYSGTLVVTAYDWKGNAYPTSFPMVYDNSRPTVKLTQSESLYPDKRYYTEDPFTVTVTAEDDNGIDRIVLYVDDEPVDLDENNSYTFTPTENRYYSFRAEVFDKAGNSNTAYLRPYISQDTYNPYFSPFSLSRYSAYVGNEITFKAIAKDNETGVRSAAYYLNDEPITLDENGEYLYKATAAGEFIFKGVVEDNRGNTAEKTAVLRISEDTSGPSVSVKADRNREMVVNTPVVYTVIADDNVGVTKITAELNGQPVKLNKDNQFTYRPTETGTLKFIATAYDAAGNQRSYTHQLTVIEEDTTPPTINGYPSSRYELNDRTSTVNFTVQDNTEVVLRNIYLDGVKFEEPELVSSSPKYSYTDRVSFVPTEIGVGEHTFKVVGRDRAGNRTEKAFPFTVSDTYAPNISMSGNTYYSTGDTMTVQVNITDFSQLASVTATLDDTPVAMTADNNQTVTLENAAAGTHTFTVTAKDIYGNEKTVSRKLTVRDTAAPVITLSDVQEEYFMPNLPVIKMTVTDNVEVTTVNVTLNGTAVTFDGEQIILPDNMAEGDYTLKITAKDAAGNTANETASFHYGPFRDTIPPTITNITVNPTKPDVGTTMSLIITASDDSGTVDITVTAPDGTSLTGENGIFTYTPAAAGTLSFTVTAADPSGNTTARLVTVNVAEDAQAPVVSVNAPATMKLGDTLNLTVTAADNKGVTKIGLLLNDQAVTLSNNTYSFKPDKEGDYSFTAYAEDVQGNRGEKSFVISVVDQPSEQELQKYLVIDDETTIGPAAIAKADELKTAAAVYDYVKNNIRTQFYSGSRKGANAAFEQFGGNDVDTASLTIGMLRHLGYPARYVTGYVRYTQEELLSLMDMKNITDICNLLATVYDGYKLYTTESDEYLMDLPLTWVEVYAPLSETGAKSEEKAWITLTPFNKTYDLEIVSSKQDSPDEEHKKQAEQILQDIAAVEQSGADIDFSKAKARFTNMLNDQERVVKLNHFTIHPMKISALPASPEWNILSKSNTYADLPDSESDTVSFTISGGYFNYDYYDDVVLGRVKTSDITGKRVLIQYLPATDSDRQQFERVNGNWKELSSDSINVKPTLTVDGEIIGQGYAVPLGTVQSLSTNLRYDGQNNTLYDKLTAGSMYDIVLNLYDIAAEDINRTYNYVKENAANNNGYQPYSEEYLGALLDYAGKMYFALNDQFEVMNTSSMNISLHPGIAFGIFGYEFYTDTNSVTQITRLTDGNFFTDIGQNPHRSFNITENADNLKRFNFTDGYLGSYLEGFIWEYILEAPCVSTAAILAQASLENIDILVINSKNADKLLPELDVETSVYNDVVQHLNKGFEVVIPKTKVTIDKWTGSGYILTDPDNNCANSVFRISGGLNGGGSAGNPNPGETLLTGENRDLLKDLYVNIDPDVVTLCFSIRVWMARTSLFISALALAGSIGGVVYGSGVGDVAFGAMGLYNGIQSYQDGIDTMVESIELFLDYAINDSVYSGNTLIEKCIEDMDSFGLNLGITIGSALSPTFSNGMTLFTFIKSAFGQIKDAWDDMLHP